MKKYLFFLLGGMAWLLVACSGVPIPAPSAQRTPIVLIVPTPTPYFYEVQSGDTLWSIAEKVGLDIGTLVVANELDLPDTIRPGDRLLVSSQVTISGRPLPTATPTPFPCRNGCSQPPPGCVIKGYHARLDGMRIYVVPRDEIYSVQQADVWFCRERDALDSGWLHWTPRGPRRP